MEILELKAEKRQSTGKGESRSLRREGKIPAVLYGPDTQPVYFSINEHEFITLLKNAQSSQQLIKIDTGDGEQQAAMIKELQTKPVTEEILHIDFYKVDMNRKIRVRVPIIVKGKSIGVELGGLLQIVRRKLEVLCLPLEIPESIEIDVTDLDVGDSVHVEDISLQGDIEIPADVNFTVITVLAPKKEEVVEEEEEEEEGLEEEGAEEEPSDEESADKEQK
ncbi:MAG: 50S ribosomal protein L25/general stress protein Ctc [Deltaproteobacteria bacterium]|nr:50S ribosomal protein L25/general stress protein Ctc [Deltaproteobacteria bacterium]